MEVKLVPDLFDKENLPHTKGDKLKFSKNPGLETPVLKCGGEKVKKGLSARKSLVNTTPLNDLAINSKLTGSYGKVNVIKDQLGTPVRNSTPKAAFTAKRSLVKNKINFAVRNDNLLEKKKSDATTERSNQQTNSTNLVNKIEKRIDRMEYFLSVPEKATVKRSPVDVLSSGSNICPNDEQCPTESQISEFVDNVLLKCLEDVAQHELEDDLPSIIINPPTPMVCGQVEATPAVTASDDPMLDISAVEQASSTSECLKTAELGKQIEMFDTDPTFDLNKDTCDIICDSCKLSDSHLLEIRELHPNLSSCDITAILADDSVHQDYFNKENISPSHATAFSSYLCVDCDNVYSPANCFDDVKIQTNESLRFDYLTLFSPSSSVVNTNDQSQQNGSVLASLPISYTDYEGSDTSINDDQEMSSVFMESQKNLLTEMNSSQNPELFAFDSSNLISEEKITVYEDSAPKSLGFQVVNTSRFHQPKTCESGCSPIKNFGSAKENNNLVGMSIMTANDHVDKSMMAVDDKLDKSMMTVDNSVNRSMMAVDEKLDKSMMTVDDHVDKSMMAVDDLVHKSMMTDSTHMTNVQTDMTPIRLLNKRGKRITAEEVRKQHPRTVANHIDTTLVCNEKLEVEVKNLTKEKNKMKSVIKDLKAELTSTKKQLECAINDDNEKQSEVKFVQVDQLKQIIDEQKQEIKDKIREYKDLKAAFDELVNIRPQPELNTKQSPPEQLEDMKLNEPQHRDYAIQKEHEDQINFLSLTIAENETLMNQQSVLKDDLQDMLRRVENIIHENLTQKQQMKLEWSYFEDKKKSTAVEVEACKMNNMLLVDECAELRQSLSTANETLTEMEVKYLEAEKDILTAASRLDMATRELELSRNTIQELGSLEDDLSTVSTELQVLQCKLNQTEDSLQHEQYRFSNLQEEYDMVKTELEDNLKQSEILALNLQRTVDYRESDIEKLESGLLDNDRYIEKQKIQIDQLEEQLFTCNEHSQQKDVEIATMKENSDLLLGERNICLQSALELEEKVKCLQSTVEILENIKLESDRQHSQLSTSYKQLEQDYVSAQQSFQNTKEKYMIERQEKDVETHQAKDIVVHLKSRMSAYIRKLQTKTNTGDVKSHKSVRQSYAGYSSNLDSCKKLKAFVNRSFCDPVGDMSVNQSNLCDNLSIIPGNQSAYTDQVLTTPPPSTPPRSMDGDVSQLPNDIHSELAIVENKFEKIQTLVSTFEKMSTKSTDDLLADKEDLEDFKLNLENKLHQCKLELAMKSDLINEKNHEVLNLEKRLHEINNCILRFSDQQDKVKHLERENSRLLTTVQSKEDEINLLTEELNRFFSRSQCLDSSGTDDRRELLDLKRKNQYLRTKILEDYNSYSESETKSQTKIKNLQENLSLSKAEVSQYSELVEKVKDTLVSNRKKIENTPTLIKLLNIIKGSDSYTTPVNSSFQSLYDSFMF